jgi:ABC-type xylose transport system permease subunit
VARDRARSPLRRLSALRITIVVVLLVTIVLAFANWLGPFRGVFRFLLVIGALAIVLSYVVEWVRSRRR